MELDTLPFIVYSWFQQASTDELVIQGFIQGGREMGDFPPSTFR